jgi:hypothetical protein
MHEELAKLQSAKDRIDSYMVPRLMTLEPASMELAMNRGDADWQAFLAQAAAGHVDEGLGARIRACADPNWLPF